MKRLKDVSIGDVFRLPGSGYWLTAIDVNNGIIKAKKQLSWQNRYEWVKRTAIFVEIK